jgi:hypothetical protein
MHEANSNFVDSILWTEATFKTGCMLMKLDELFYCIFIPKLWGRKRRARNGREGWKPFGRDGKRSVQGHSS